VKRIVSRNVLLVKLIRSLV